MRISSRHDTRQQPSFLSRSLKHVSVFSFLKLHFLYIATQVRISNGMKLISEKWVGREKKSQIDLLAYFSIKTDCMKDLLGGKKELFMEKSVTLRRDITQAEMTKPFLIHDGSVFFFFV